ncbi:MAG TPA: hypothetical protein VHJ20_18685 [Polyangia bacterium]|nr:hypothetical protein [Polyangia bacterium]
MPNPSRISRMALVFAASGLVSMAACSKGDDASKAASVPPLPAAPPPAPAAPPPERSPASPGGASAGGSGPSQGPDSIDPNATITGQITVAASVKAHVLPTDTLFLVARRPSETPGVRGSLIAVKKLSAAKLPLDFTLSAADMPFQGGTFDGDVTLSIRDDKDNDPMTRLKGDVFGTLPKVHVGARNVKLPLDQLQKEDESLTGANPHGGPMQMGGGGPMGGGALPPGHP